MTHYGRTFHSGTTSDLSAFNSIMAGTPKGGVSVKYVFIPTTRVVSALDSMGWKPVRCTEQRVHLPGDTLFLVEIYTL